MKQKRSLYMGIGKPGQEQGEKWEHIGGYPEVKEGEVHPVWTTKNTAFEEHIDSMLEARHAARVLVGL
jgi:hypothetical protein